ncbi:MAG TPA: hypothetical protein VNN07_18845 [Candidatus Tectomicrobia bacterium]|nr:hypothetical protein [Candidatus Tectomicrobia bacterium]
MSAADDVNHYFRQAARIMDLSPRVERMLVVPFREVKDWSASRGASSSRSTTSSGRTPTSPPPT